MDEQLIESSTEEDSSVGQNVLLSARVRQLETAKDEDSAGKQSDLEREEDDSNEVSDNFDNFVHMKRVLDMIHIVLTDKEDDATGSSDIQEPPALPPPQEPPKVIEDSEEVNTSSSEDSGSTVKAWRILTDRVRRKRSGTAVPRKARRSGAGSAYSTTKKRPAASRSSGRPTLRRASRSTVASRASAATPPPVDTAEDLEGGGSEGDGQSSHGGSSQLPPLPPESTAGMLRRAAERGAAPPPGVRPLAAARRPAACRVVGPVLAELEAMPPHGLQPPAGLALLDVHFHMPTNVSEVVFRNHYTASVSVLVRAVHYTSAAKVAAARASSPRGTAAGGTDPAGDAGVDATQAGEEWPWEMSIPCRVLMEDPHYETDAQDYFSLLFTESVVPWRNLLSMRLVLRQPSPCWPHHTVRDVTVYSEPPPVSLRIAPRRLFASDCDMQEHNEAWKTVQLNTINSMTPSVYRPRTAPGSQVLPDYEIDTL